MTATPGDHAGNRTHHRPSSATTHDATGSANG